MKIDYSVVIRTLGHANEKYEMLLKSIECLKPSPKELIIVLPEGANLPIQKPSGCFKVSYLYAPKGMVSQRIYGTDYCSTEYMLVCDDDVSFASDFVEKLAEPLICRKADFSIGPLLEFLPEKGMKSLYNTISLTAIPTIFHKNMYIHVLRSSGWSYNRHINTGQKRWYYTQSAAWTCYFARTNAMQALRFDEEFWLDMNGYASFDDSSMFYKAWLMNYKTVMVSNAVYEHLDARTSVSGIKRKVIFSTAFNQYVFWHRFIYSNDTSVGKILDIVCYQYFEKTNYLLEYIKSKRDKKSLKKLDIMKQGSQEARRFVKSDRYLQLHSIE